MKVGIFFGGQSREREISFAGGRTVYDNLNKSLFEAVPIFIDSLGNFILLDWEFIYKGTIRDFYPPASVYPPDNKNFQLYIESIDSPEQVATAIDQIGKKIEPSDLSEMIDFAFLALHGPYGEDGNLQGILEWYNIPYSGSGILPSAIGINKSVQKALMSNAGFNTPDFSIIKRTDWDKQPDQVLKSVTNSFDFPLVVKSPNQGSSIGISIVESADELTKAINKGFFIEKVVLNDWQSKSDVDKIQWIARLTDIREGTGLPVYLNEDQVIYQPNQLLEALNVQSGEEAVLLPFDSEEELLIESFIAGREFSCIVIQDDQGKPIALPPTEIRKSTTLFDYRAKYLPGVSRKITPIDLSSEEVEKIRKDCERLFITINCNVYARIDGFYTQDGEIFLNDPNTTSGMLPSSFFFHQAAEINLTPSDFLTYIIKTSMAQRIRTGKRNIALRKELASLERTIESNLRKGANKRKVAVIMGGFSSERHISVESGRNIFEKLNSSGDYTPIPFFLTGSEAEHELYLLPINIMLKDNADDIKSKIADQKGLHPIIRQIREEAKDIIDTYAQNKTPEIARVSYESLSSMVEFAFIALHGRPGEDGAIQQELEKYHIPYNGSGIPSSQKTINKAETNSILKNHGVLVADHLLCYQDDFQNNREKTIDSIESTLQYPLIAKPADDGCSSAVKKINSRQELIAFAKMMFRLTDDDRDQQSVDILGLKPKEEFPIKSYFMIEELIDRKDAIHFLEITGGMLTSYNEAGEIEYNVFEPSEALASGEVLSLEEKFLAGEGQNITPARFSKNPSKNAAVSESVRKEFEKVARILNVEGYCRIDAFVRIYENRTETIIIEINSLPGMTPATCIFHQSAIADLKPYQFINEIIQYGFDKRKKSLKTY
ncbi:MAG: D-alanine--D-alanine ligase [Bacteroidota bacterium]